MGRSNALFASCSWYEEGENVLVLLPALAAYMGHVGMDVMERYLSLTPAHYREQVTELTKPLKQRHPQRLIQSSTISVMYNNEMSTFTAVIAELEQERARLTNQLAALRNAIAALNGSGSNSAPRTKTMSAAGRARIGAAQRARWAKVKKSKVVSIAAGKKRKLSASALAHIRDGQKARWAKWRKQHKSA